MNSNDKHAYLIIAHHQFDLLKILCQLIDHPYHDIFIHIDSKAEFNPEPLKSSTRYSPVIFTSRTNVVWGGYSQINCELLMLKSALDHNPEGYSFYHLISGVDLPLKPASEIYEFFQANKGKEFISSGLGDAGWNEKIKKRINHYCIFQEKAGRTNNVWKKRQDKLRHWQYTFKIDRTKHLNKTILSGSNWFSISHKLAEYIINNEKWIKKHFNHTVCADEVFLQTLINGTEFENMLYTPMPQHTGAAACMRYVDWQRGDPYTFTQTDFDELINCGCLFARKFDIENHSEICHMIYRHLTQK